MNVKRYFATTAREALRALKAELGADAIVLANRAVEGGVEILALPAEAVGAIEASARASARSATSDAASHAKPAVVRPEQAHDDDYTVSLSSRARPAPDSGDAARAARAAQTIRPFEPPRIDRPAAGAQRARAYAVDDLAGMNFGMPPRPAASAPQARPGQPGVDDTQPTTEPRPRERDPAPAAPAQVTAEDERIRALQDTNTQLMTELAGIRGMIERQLAGFAWGETRRNAPARAQIVGELLEAGFSAALARQLAEAVDEQASIDEAHEQVRTALGRDLRAMSSDADLIDQGGVYALVGPTGVGKTTTTAKIAARCVVRHGAEKLALITTDGYRIGAQEQLRIYGRILGVPVFPVRDAADLRQTLAELRGKHMVLIDTVGMSQRDRMVAQQAAMLMGAGNVRRVLLLNATSRGDTLDDVVKAYRGPDLAGCVLTKVDEAATLAPVIGAAIGHGLEVLYVTNGQRVPEDLHLPNRSYLMHRALRLKPEDSPWRLKADEAALMLGAGGKGR